MTNEDEARAARLMTLAQHGDQAAYAELLAMLTTLATRFVRRRLGSAHWVDDVVQETLMSVHRARHTWRPDRPFGPWFSAILTHREIDVYRRERRVRLREHVEEALEAVAPAAPVETHDDGVVDMAAVRAALASLPPRQRDIVAGLKLREESVKHLANRHQMSESAVKVMAHRGYRRLRAILGGQAERKR